LDPQNINTKDPKLGYIPLYKAVLYGDEEIVELLLKNGADPNIQNDVSLNFNQKLGEACLHLAVNNNLLEIV